MSGLSDDHPDSYMNIARTLAAQNDGWFDVNQGRFICKCPW